MVKRTLIGVTLALLTAGVCQPVKADTKFLEPYDNLFGARTILGSPADTRPKDALQAQASNVKDPKTRVSVSPFFRVYDLEFGDEASLLGGTFTWADMHNVRHPFQAQVSLFSYRSDTLLRGESDKFSYDANFRYVIWTPERTNLPVMSVIYRHRWTSEYERRTDALFAADQQLTHDLYATLNLGWAERYQNFENERDNDFVPGFGLTWHPRSWNRFSTSFDYVFHNEVDGEDHYGFSFLYTLDKLSSVRIGAGKHNLVYGNYIAKLDLR